jgi:hypothetical protein
MGNTTRPTLPVGTRVEVLGERGEIVAVRRPKFPRRYEVLFACGETQYLRRDEFAVIGGAS